MTNDVMKFACFTICVTFLVILFFRLKFAMVRRKTHSGFPSNHNIIGFFHPNCSAGGGGERVLWSAISVLGRLYVVGLKINIVVYTADILPAGGSDVYKKELLKHVESRFSISIEPSVPIRFVHITNVVSEVPLSMVAQSFASMKVSYRALNKVNPDIFFDTTGCAFTFLVARVLAGCKVAAYVHYPTISTDMLALVWDRRPTYNNDSKISSSMIRSYLKMLYYILFSIAYGFVGSLATLVMVNSTWTNNHIRYLWRFAKKTDIVYPPCDTQSLEDLSLNGREEVIISIGQFRPEKDHALQLRAFSILLHSNTSKRFENVRMKLIGSCRGESDKMRVRQLQKLAKKLDLTDRVEFVLNQPYPVLKKWFGRASIGIHTMWNEHFGIGVVEMLAAGLVTIAHKSGGPKSDIISPGENGYLASTAEEYAQIMAVVLEGGADSRKNIDIRQKARESAKRFSDQIFSDAFEKVFLSSGLLQ